MSLTHEQLILYNPLKGKLQSLGYKIKSIIEQGRLVKSDRSQLFLFKGMYTELRPYFTTFNSTWDNIQELMVTWGISNIFPSQDDKTLQKNVERYYYEACAIYEEYMNPTPSTTAAATNSSPSTSLNESRTVRARLPQLNLPTFSGKQGDWPLFRDTYCSLIHNEATLSDIEKFLFLTSSLQGPALTLIKSIEVAEANYDQAWKLLNETYNDKRRLASSYLRTIIDFVPFKSRPSANALQHLLTTVGESIQSFKKLKIPDGEDFILFCLFLRCLDPGTRKAFERQHPEVEYPTVRHLMDFTKVEWKSSDITNEDTNYLSTPNTTAKGAQFRFGKGSKSHSSLFVGQRSTPSTDNKGSSSFNFPAIPRNRCPVCNSRHTLYQCAEFRRLTPAERMSSLKKWNGCTNCLSSKHTKHACLSTKRCQNCSMDHHTWLHCAQLQKTVITDTTTKPAVQPAGNSQGVVLGSISSVSVGLLGTTIVEIKDPQGFYHKIRAVIDCGSQHSLITEECCKTLDLVVSQCTQKLSGIGQTPLKGTLGRLVCCIRSTRGIRSDLVTNAIVVTNITGPLPGMELPPSIQALYNSFALADHEYWKPGPVDFLIGGDIFYDILTGPPIILAPKVPRLMPTIFGFVIAGPMEGEKQHLNATSLLIQHGHDIVPQDATSESAEDIKTILEKFWELEEVSKGCIIPEEDKLCESHYEATHYRLASGRYVVSLPLKDSVFSLGNPVQQAAIRLRSLEKKLERQPDLKAEYHRFMQEYLSMGHMQLAAAGTSSYTIPHHAVTKNHHDHFKLRVVFDASCNTCSGSLNDHMLTGPKLQADIADVITNFRLHTFVFTADIVKMYRQIQLNPADRKYQHILWRFDPLEDIQDYELCTVTYGIKAAPFLAQRTIKQLVCDDGAPYPLASRALLQDIYVDDVVTGANTLSDVHQLKEELIMLLNKGGFQLSKWASNCAKVLETLPDEDIVGSNITLADEDDPKIKLLGIQWNQREDVLSYEISPPLLIMTKRAMLSSIARIYDPLGFLSPVTFYAKTILQEMWSAKVGWDEPGPSKTCKRWRLFLEQLPYLTEIKIPRLAAPLQMTDLTLVGFCDASLRGYSAVFYLHSAIRQTCNVSLLRAKTKLAPLKSMSIPRLELSGALLLCRLFQSLKDFMTRMNIKDVNFFTDSQTVLGWLSTPPARCNTFVAHRVVEILEHSERTQWHFVQSENNPADCSSRGILPCDLLHHPLWWAGAPWLCMPKDSWPTPTLPPQQELPEIKSASFTAVALTLTPGLDEWMTRFSSYLKLVRTTGYILRFGNRLKDIVKEAGSITVSEFRRAEIILIKVIQRRYTIAPDVISGDKTLLPLRPFLDEQGILRVGGRLHSSLLPYESKHPILLPAKCHFAKILVDYYHQTYLHVGPSALQAILRRKYWILGARTLVRQRVFQCLKCYKSSRLPAAPLMGNLPPSRLEEGSAFANVGVDFGGPFYIRESSRRKAALGKAYLCLFVCLSTKAIHLEVVSSCSTDAFLAAFSRFVSRRGKPTQVFSDCGTNFIGAANRLRDLYILLRTADFQERITNHTAPQEIKWSFNPPASPHFGGLWEAGIKSSKAILRKVIGEAPLTYEELTTLFCRIEGILNSRPLVPLTSDPDATDCLTPGHFLIGRQITALPERQHSDHVTPLQRWRMIQQKAQHFWSRWRLEYLNHLQQRGKWRKDRPNLKVGDVVIIKETNAPQLKWPLARVVQTHPGPDGIVRVVSIRTISGTYKRPIVKLVPLTPITNYE